MQDEPGPFVGPPIEIGVIDQPQDRFRPGQVAAGQSTKDGIVLPGPILEPPVPRRGNDVGPIGCNPGQLHQQAAGTPGGSRRPGTGQHRTERPRKSEEIHRTEQVAPTDGDLGFGADRRIRHKGPQESD